MKERPIVCAGREVRRILNGNQTALRRPVGAAPDGPLVYDPGDGTWYVDGGAWSHACPLGIAGDRLWIRETWAIKKGKVLYAAAGRWDDDYIDETKREMGIDRWRSPIAMSRARSRVTLEVVEVRCERAQSITEEGAKANGAGPEFEADLGSMIRGGAPPPSTHVLGFKHEWDRRNPKAQWVSNPWCWVVSFRRVSK